MRFQREKSPVFTTEDTPFTPGKAEIFWQSKRPQVLIIGCGALVHSALLAARELEKEKIGTTVLNVHTIKPLDEEKIVSLVKKIGAVVTVEEHQISGGLGGAVAETLGRRAPAPIEFIGLHDTFGESGLPSELLEKYGMGIGSIKSAAKKVLKRKR